MAAFERAVSNGYGIELDVQVTKDKLVAVFHDEDLQRMCGLDIRVANLTERDMLSAELGTSGQRIPTLQQVLDLVDGRVLLLIEIKPWVKGTKNLYAILNSLLPYQEHGIFAIQSFSPQILGWFYKRAPLIPRGQISCGFRNERMNSIKKYLLREGKLNSISKPDFLSYDVSDLPKEWIERKRQCGMPVLGWTAKSPEMYTQAGNFCDNIIFEGFSP